MDVETMLFSISDITNMLGVHDDTVREWCCAGYLNAEKDLKKRYYTVTGKDFIDFLHRTPKYAESLFSNKRLSGKSLEIQKEIRNRLISMPLCLTYEQLAEYLSITSYSIRRWVRRGYLKPTKYDENGMEVKGIYLKDIRKCFKEHPILKYRYSEILERKLKNDFGNV